MIWNGQVVTSQINKMFLSQRVLRWLVHCQTDLASKLFSRIVNKSCGNLKPKIINFILILLNFAVF